MAERQRREQGGVHTPTKDPAAALPHSAATTPATSTPTLAATPAATATEDADPGPPAAGERRAEASTPKDNTGTGVSATKPGARRDARKAVAASITSADEAIAAAIALVNVSPCRSSASIKRPKPKEGRPVACGSGAEAPTAKPAATSAPRPATPRIGPSPSPNPSPSPSPALKSKPTSQSKAKSGAVAKPKSSGKGSKKGSGSTPPQNREWAHGDLLAEALAIQAMSNFDPDSLFFEFRETGCDLEEIFQRLSISYTARGSTGNWEADRITPTEELVYKRQCGYETMPSLTDLTEPEEDGGDVEAARAGAV